MCTVTPRSRRTRLALCLSLTSGLGLPVAAIADHGDGRVETVLVEGKHSQLALEHEQALTPGGVTLVDSTEMYERSVSNLSEMLRFVPGIWAQSSSGGDAMFFSSRGSNLDATNYDMNGIKLMQDGLPVTTADGNNHNRMIDPLSASNAVIARGANALTYGASTLGGAIDFISPTAHNTESQLFLNGGSDGHIQGRLTATTVSGDFDGLITVDGKQRDGFREHSEQERSGVYANAGWKINDALHTRLYLTYIDNDEELPGPLTAEQFADDPYQAESAAITGHYQVNVESWRIANKTGWDINSNSSLSFGLSYEEQTLYHPIVDKVMVDFDGDGPMPPVEVFSLLINTDQDTFGSSLRYNLNAGDHDILAGINYGRSTVTGGQYRNDNGQRNGLTTITDNTAESVEAFLMDRWQFADRWKLVYGLQAVTTSRDVRNTDVESNTLRNPKADYDSINPRVGVIYQASPDSEWFANISRLYEAPTNYELEDDIRGNDETLDAMKGTVLEVGSRGSKTWGDRHQWYWEVSLYYGQLKDEILSIDDPDEPGTSLSSNVDNTIHAGVEALFGASLALDSVGEHRIEPRLNLTINEFSFDDDPIYGNNQLPAAPGYAIKGEVMYRHNSGFFGGATFDLVDERYSDFSNTYTVDSYALLGLRTGFSSDRWEVYGELRNLTDKDYVSVHTVRDIAPVDDALLYAGEPRSFFVGVKWQF